MMDAATLEKQAMQLPAPDRALLADHLIESLLHLPGAVKDAWIAEADNRMEAYRAGEIQALDGPQAMAELRARFGR